MLLLVLLLVSGHRVLGAPVDEDPKAQAATQPPSPAPPATENPVQQTTFWRYVPLNSLTIGDIFSSSNSDNDDDSSSSKDEELNPHKWWAFRPKAGHEDQVVSPGTTTTSTSITVTSGSSKTDSLAAMEPQRTTEPPQRTAVSPAFSTSPSNEPLPDSSTSTTSTTAASSTTEKKRPTVNRFIYRPKPAKLSVLLSQVKQRRPPTAIVAHQHHNKIDYASIFKKKPQQQQDTKKKQQHPEIVDKQRPSVVEKQNEAQASEAPTEATSSSTKLPTWYVASMAPSSTTASTTTTTFKAESTSKKQAPSTRSPPRPGLSSGPSISSNSGPSSSNSNSGFDKISFPVFLKEISPSSSSHHSNSINQHRRPIATVSPSQLITSASFLPAEHRIISSSPSSPSTGLKTTTAKVKLNVLEGRRPTSSSITARPAAYTGHKLAGVTSQLVTTSQKLVETVQTQLLLHKEMLKQLKILHQQQQTNNYL